MYLATKLFSHFSTFFSYIELVASNNVLTPVSQLNIEQVTQFYVKSTLRHVMCPNRQLDPNRSRSLVPAHAGFSANICPPHHHISLFRAHTKPLSQTHVVHVCMMGVVWCSNLLVQCSRELELFSWTRQRSDGRPLCSTPQQHSTRRNSLLMSLLRST